MSIQELTKHPELMNRETLYELRRITATYPYYQTARILLLKNLYLLHDPSFDEELRRSAIYFTDRRILFNLVEAAHYRLKKKSPQSFASATAKRQQESAAENESRTVSLIDNFLSTIPEEADIKEKESKKKAEPRKPTAVDATTDYVAYLLSTDFEELEGSSNDEQPNDNLSTATGDAEPSNEQPRLKGGDLIDAFINNDGGKITLQDELEYAPEEETDDDSNETPADEYLTETLAGIYIKQKRYEKALDIMEKINASTKKKNRYFEDQKRFLQLLIANSRA